MFNKDALVANYIYIPESIKTGKDIIKGLFDYLMGKVVPKLQEKVVSFNIMA